MLQSAHLLEVSCDGATDPAAEHLFAELSNSNSKAVEWAHRHIGWGHRIAVAVKTFARPKRGDIVRHIALDLPAMLVAAVEPTKIGVFDIEWGALQYYRTDKLQPVALG
jgi:hypothetical protein